MATKRKIASKARGSKSLVKNVRSKILSVASREREKFNRKTGEYERVPLTMGEIAKKIGVSVSTLRRWKNQGVTPRARSRKEIRRLERLATAAKKAARATAAEDRRDARKHPGKLRITKRDLPALPVGHRRKLKRYRRGDDGRIRATGEEFDSSIVNYNVRGWTFREIAALIQQAWKAGKPFQFVYEVPAGGSLPKSGRAKERKVRHTTRAGTAPIDPFGIQSQEELLTILNRYIDVENGEFSRRMVYVSIDDNYSGPQGDEEDVED